MDTNTSIVVGLQREKLPVTTYVDGYFWRCEECGWLGLGHFSQQAAIKEAGRHWDDQHSDVRRGDVEFIRPPLHENDAVRSGA